MKQIQTYIITGIMSIIPIALTYWIIKSLFLFFSGPGGSIIGIFFPESLNSQYIIGDYIVKSPIQKILGFILTIIFLYILGLIISNVIGKKMYKIFESLLSRIPVVNKIYKSIKQITATLSMPNSKAFQKVVLIEYPRKGVWAVGFATKENTGEMAEKTNKKLINVFVPTTPNPTSGFLLMFPIEDVIYLNMTFEEASKFIVSAGTSNKQS